MERYRQWALRICHEAELHVGNSFITLTYSDEKLPEGGSLDVKDWQRFAKRLRKRCGPFRFFQCGEYGEKNWRPHFHACVFGLDFKEDRELVSRKGNPLYKSPLLEEIWGHGIARVGALTFESAAYVSRYVMKKQTGRQADEHYTRVDEATGEVRKLRPEFTTMSRRPGIGTRWFEMFGSDVYPADHVVYQGRKFRPPRFYDSMLSEEELATYKAKRLREAQKRSDELTPERLKAREKFEEAKAKALQARCL